MITRRDVVWLGIASALSGGLVGGILLAVGIALVLDRQLFGVVLAIAGVPASALIGWLLGRRLAQEMEGGRFGEGNNLP